MMRRFGSLCEFCLLPPFLLDDNGSGRGGAHTSKEKTGEDNKVHYTVRGFGKDGHAWYTFHIPCGSEDDAKPFQNGGDWEAKKHLDVGKHCVDLRKSLVKGGLDGETERRQTVLSAECLAQLRRWIK